MADTFILNPFTGRLDDTGTSQATKDARYIKKAGDTISGDLTISVLSTGMILTDGVHQWRITVNSNGALVTTQL